MLKFLKEPKDGRPWLDFGGAETLRSYQISVPEPSEPPEVLALAAAALDRALPGVVHELLEALALSVTVGDYMFVHAGVRPGVKLTAQKEIDLLWIREPFLSSKADFGKIVVHGHTAETTPLLRDNRVGIDTGAYATGVLTAIRLYGTDYKLLSTGSTPRHTVGD